MNTDNDTFIPLVSSLSTLITLPLPPPGGLARDEGLSRVLAHGDLTHRAGQYGGGASLEGRGENQARSHVTEQRGLQHLRVREQFLEHIIFQNYKHNLRIMNISYSLRSVSVSGFRPTNLETSQLSVRRYDIC